MIRGQHSHYLDQVRYSAEQVEAAIPGVWDDDHVFSGPAWATPARRPEHVPVLILEVADVDRAYYRSGLTEPERTILRLVYSEKWTPGELAEAWHEKAERVAGTAASGIRKITRYLNGETPQ